MLNHKGTSRIETERLILRRFELNDVEDMFNNWANDSEVTKYLTWLPHKNKDFTKEIINSWVKGYDNLEVYNWAIVPRNYGKVIGSISVVEYSNDKERCEVGYCIATRYWNQGFMTEALKAVIKYLIYESGFKRVYATHDIENPASGKVMIKAGMKYEGRSRKYNKNNKGQFVDCDIYAIVDEDIKL
jgi:ribosomal-protein-alanine N-acetyltransferase